MTTRNKRSFPRKLTSLNSVATSRYCFEVLSFHRQKTVEFLLESEIRTSMNRIPVLQATGCVTHIDDTNDFTRFALNHEFIIAGSQSHQPPCNRCPDIHQYTRKKSIYKCSGKDVMTPKMTLLAQLWLYVRGRYLLAQRLCLRFCFRCSLK